MSVNERERRITEERMARVSILQELTVNALELFDPKRSPDGFLERLGERLGCYATLLVFVGPRRPPLLLGASGLPPAERELQISEDAARALIERGEEPSLPYPTLARSGLELWHFPIRCRAGTRAALLLYFLPRGSAFYRGMTAQLAEVLETVLVHRQLLLATRASERRTEEQRVLLTRVSEASGIGMLVIGSHDEVAFCNHLFLEMFTLDEDMERCAWSPVVVAAAARFTDPAGFVERIERLVAQPGRAARWEQPTTDGRVLECFSSTVEADSGGTCGRALYLRDVTDRIQAVKKSQQELEVEQRARAEVEDALQARDELISMASHELRTPLSGLELALEGLREELLADEGEHTNLNARALEIAERQSKRLVRLVDTLLDVTRMRAGRLALDLETVDLAKLVREVCSRLEGEASRAGSTLSVKAEGTVIGSWDRSRLDQVATNLLTNAIKYGGGEPVEVTVRRDDDVAHLIVHDHGPGIEAEQLERIFERFERAGRKRGTGLGLGLFIVRHLVESHGGTVEVASEPGVGTTFEVRLPLQQP